MEINLCVKNPNTLAVALPFVTDDILRLMQDLVGGYVERVPIGSNVVILCNEDGIEHNLPANCGFLGTIVFVEVDHGEWVGLSKENQLKALKWCEINQFLEPLFEEFVPKNPRWEVNGDMNDLCKNIDKRLKEWDKL